MLMIMFKGIKAAAYNIRGNMRGQEKCLLMHHQQAPEYMNESNWSNPKKEVSEI